MELNEVPPGSTIYLDANILVYHFAGESAQCTELLKRVVQGEVHGWMGAHTYAEVVHRLMMLEARTKSVLTGSNPARKAKSKPEAIRNLADYQRDANAIPILVPDIASLLPEDVTQSSVQRNQFGVLVNDSLSLALMARRGTIALATADRDFLRVTSLQVYVPSDLR
ncbi:MAG: type II toxin-antitoxin system VapC family toxin [Actinomycetota bacterium]